MSYSLHIPELTEFEADHVSEILSDYKRKILMEKIEAIAARDENRIQWIDSHLKWHDSILNKVIWEKS